MEDDGFVLEDIESASDWEDGGNSQILTSQESQKFFEGSDYETQSDDDFEPKRRKRSKTIIRSENEDSRDPIGGDEDGSEGDEESRDDVTVLGVFDSEEGSRSAFVAIDDESRDSILGDDEGSDSELGAEPLQRQGPSTSRTKRLVKTPPAKKLKVQEVPVIEQEKEPELKPIPKEKLKCPKFFYDGNRWNFEIDGHCFDRSEGDGKEGSLRCAKCSLTVVVGNGKTVIYANPHSPNITECRNAQSARVLVEIKSNDLEFGLDEKDAYIVYRDRKFVLKHSISTSISIPFHSKRYIIYSAKLAEDAAWRFFVDGKIGEDKPGNFKLLDRSCLVKSIGAILQGLNLPTGSIRGVTRTLCYEIIAHYHARKMFRVDEMWGRRVTDRAVMADPLIKTTPGNALKDFVFDIRQDQGYYLNERLYHAYFKDNYRYRITYLVNSIKFKCKETFCGGEGRIVPGRGLILDIPHDNHPLVTDDADISKREFAPKELKLIGTDKLIPAFTDEKHTYIGSKRMLLKEKQGRADTYVTEFTSTDDCRAWYMDKKWFRERRHPCNAKATRRTYKESEIHLVGFTGWERNINNIPAKQIVHHITNDQKLKCTLIPGCKRTFRDKYKLEFHLKNASNPKATFQCPSCCEKFPSRRGLNNHTTAIHVGFDEKIKKFMKAYVPSDAINVVKWQNVSSLVSFIPTQQVGKSRDIDTDPKISRNWIHPVLISGNLKKAFRIVDSQLIRQACIEKYQKFIDEGLSEENAYRKKFVWTPLKGFEQNVRYNPDIGAYQVRTTEAEFKKILKPNLRIRMSLGGWHTLCSNEACLGLLKESDSVNLCIRHATTSTHIAMCYLFVSVPNRGFTISSAIFSSGSGVGGGGVEKLYEMLHESDEVIRTSRCQAADESYFLCWREFIGPVGLWYANRERAHYQVVSFVKEKVMQLSTPGQKELEAYRNSIEIHDKRMLNHLAQSFQKNGIKFTFLGRQEFIEYKKRGDGDDSDWGLVWDSYKKRAWTDAHPTTLQSGSFCFCSTDIVNTHRVYDCVSCTLKKEYIGATNSTLRTIIAACHQKGKSTLWNEILGPDEHPFSNILTYVIKADIHKMESLFHFLLLLGHAYNQERCIRFDGDIILTTAVPIMKKFETSSCPFEESLIQDGSFLLFDKFLRMEYEGWDLKGDASEFIQEWMKPLDLPLDAPEDIGLMTGYESDDD